MPFPFIWAWDQHQETQECTPDGWLLKKKMNQQCLNKKKKVIIILLDLELIDEMQV